MHAISVERSGAYVERFSLPAARAGQLARLRFAVKDLIDVAGHRTGCGNPSWLAAHPPAEVSAICVEQLLAAGAECNGKTVTDELAFSLLGENYFYGTPLNAAAPDRVPGGSSSGSASAVACRLADFALGTDSGGSVRVPASNCGIWGWRPTHGAVAITGVMPLAPSYDTVGVLARDADTLQLAAQVLLGSPPAPPAAPSRLLVLTEAFDMSNPEVRAALVPEIDRLKHALGCEVRETSLAELCDDEKAADLATWRDCYLLVMAAEAACCHSTWIETARPELGPMASAGFQFVRTIDRTLVGEFVNRRERYGRALTRSLGPRDLICLPTAPTIAPLKGSIDRNSDYYQRTLSLTAIAGVARLPQVSMPLAFASGAPIGLSLIGPRGEDMFLLESARAAGQRPSER